jgi:hypothetical protein
MKSHYSSIRTRVLTVATVIFLAVSLMGCNDPIVGDMEAEHQRLGNIVKNELRKGLLASPSSSQTEVLFPAP